MLVLVAGGMFSLGTVLMATSDGLVVLIVGSALTSLGLGAFSTVYQAIVLDILPSRTEAGRFLSVVQYAQQIPHAVAPLFASALLGIAPSRARRTTARSTSRAAHSPSPVG